ncbi:MAG: type I DNA topoisomerase [Candidatus Kerfeldbacteria bacterium]|nr:type I DNA topoisomerase [Candidatus Kerfeldbacteria bacterium]
MTSGLVIVESPTKAKKIAEFLGTKYDVQSSYGHVRDLPKSAMGIDIDHGFQPEYVVLEESKKTIADLKRRAARASAVFFATDEDREGEAISWHLAELLKIPPDHLKRIVFHEITSKAILAAMAEPRGIDLRLVKAQEERRLLDRLYGYEVSPMLWRKIRPGLSAGRVQSVATRLLVERERQRLTFRSSSYWDIVGRFAPNGQSFEARLQAIAGRSVATGQDFDPTSGQLKHQRVQWLKADEAKRLAEQWRSSSATVEGVDESPFTERPSPPFTTSTLQQEANRKLRFSARRTMQLAQQLYENGYITYMRTDSTILSDEALTAARQWIKQQYGPPYLTDQPRQFTTKVKNVQEAHEAIRPAGEQFQPLEKVKSELETDVFRLYELIWKRTVASQMTEARGRRMKVAVALGTGLFVAQGKTYDFVGFRRAYVEGSDDPAAELAEREMVLPPVKPGRSLTVDELAPTEHITQPPPRLTEATLVKELETRSIGRPSTYAAIIETILRREYVFKRGPTLIPTFTAFAVVNLLEQYLPSFVDYAFTATMEDRLDAIALGQADDKAYLRQFYFGDGMPGLKPTLEHVRDTIDPRLTSGVTIGTLEDQPLEVRIGRYGPFLRWNGQTARLPEDLPPDELTIDRALALLKASQAADQPLGVDPHSGQNVYLKLGRFGPYVQLGETPSTPKDENGQPTKKRRPKKDQSSGANKPKMASLLPGMSAETVSLEQALQLLSLPRTVGLHSPDQQPILAANGRFGQYIKWGQESRSIPDGQDALTITLEQCLELLAQEKTRGRGRRVSKTLKELGSHPQTGLPIKILDGRYGPYVTDGTVNATIPSGTAPESLTMIEAVTLLTERAARPKRRRTMRRGR